MNELHSLSSTFPNYNPNSEEDVINCLKDLDLRIGSLANHSIELEEAYTGLIENTSKKWQNLSNAPEFQSLNASIRLTFKTIKEKNLADSVCQELNNPKLFPPAIKTVIMEYLDPPSLGPAKLPKHAFSLAKLPIHVLENTQNSIVYELPAGKPDPRQNCMFPIDYRSRVFQKGSKGENCLYYGMNFIRSRSDKLQRATLERRIEQIGSLRRKEIMQSSKLLPKISCSYHPDVIAFLKGMTREKVNKALQDEEAREQTSARFDSPIALEGGYPSFIPFLEEFLKQKTSENMFDFFCMRKIKILHDIDLTCLIRLKAELQIYLPKHQINLPKNSFLKSARLTRQYVQQRFSILYRLGESTWTPANTIEQLMIELKRVGPLLIAGNFGECCIGLPFKIENTLKDRDIYTWAPDIALLPAGKSQISLHHSVLLVGASKVQDEAFAYFIDPNDPSDPVDRSKQKIYRITFKNLTTHIVNMNGSLPSHNVLSLNVPYAYHGNFQLD